MELYYRFQGLMTRSRIGVVENKIRDPDDTREIQRNRGLIDPDDPAAETMGGQTL